MATTSFCRSFLGEIQKPGRGLLNKRAPLSISPHLALRHSAGVAEGPRIVATMDMSRERKRMLRVKGNVLRSTFLLKDQGHWVLFYFSQTRPRDASAFVNKSLAADHFDDDPLNLGLTLVNCDKLLLNGSEGPFPSVADLYSERTIQGTILQSSEGTVLLTTDQAANNFYPQIKQPSSSFRNLMETSHHKHASAERKTDFEKFNTSNLVKLAFHWFSSIRREDTCVLYFCRSHHQVVCRRRKSKWRVKCKYNGTRSFQMAVTCLVGFG